MADVCPVNRLVRKRNSNLQKQLEVTLHLLSEEYRQSKERMYKEERDCGKFLKSLYSTVPGLVTYGQPDTRAMNSNSMLKERRYSMSVSVHSDSEEHHNHLDPPFSRPKAPSSKAANPRPKSSTVDDRGTKTTTTQGEVSGAQTGSGESGVKPYTTERNSLAKKLRENSNFLPRPSTAGSQRKGAQTPAQDDKPSSGRFSQQKVQNPSYGKEAYSKEDRFLHERVLRRFDVIFDPETEARKVNLNTLMAPALVVEPEKEDGNDAMDNVTTASARIPHPHANVIQVNGEEFHLSKKPPAQRRVVWSANPHRKPRTVSAPHSARTERKTSEMPPSASASARQTSAGPKSSSHTATPARTKTPTAPASRPSSGKPDARIQMLALQKNLPVKYRKQDDQSDSSLESDDGGDDGDDDTDEDTEYLTKPPSQKIPEKPKAQLNQPERSKHKPCEHERKEKEQTHSKNHDVTAVPPNQHPEPNHTKYNSSSLLQVPDAHHHHHHHHQQPHHHHHQQQPHHHHHHHQPHHHHHHPPDGHSSDQNTPARGAAPGRRHSIARPSSRLSNASDITPPVELWSKLMKAGLPGRTSKRPQTAPSKSELSHRSMPAPRQTVVGILAQIENQKANTRNMINTSKELQRVVKKLVPWEQASAYDMDDW